jgi:hypothetical protein
MSKSVFSATLLIASLLAGSAFADGLVINVTYSATADKDFTKTYGDAEREVVADLIAKNLNERLGNQAARVDVVIENIIPNRPTFKQMGDRPGLSFQSFGIGGADVSGKAFDSAGNLLGEAKMDWYGDIQFADTAWIWTDADRALNFFARRLADKVPG